MPNVKRHCFSTKVKFEEEARDIHVWIDFPVHEYGPVHRLERHFYDQVLPQKFIDKYGVELAYAIMIQHLDEDFIEEVRDHGHGYVPDMENVFWIRSQHTLNDYTKNDRTYKIISIPLRGNTFRKTSRFYNYEFLNEFHSSNNSKKVE